MRGRAAVVLAWFVLTSTTARADGGYSDAVKRGRALAARGEYGPAVKAFDQALAAKPDDPVALSELGWAAFRGGELERARAATEKAVDRATEPRVKAAALFNLGRIEEASGDRTKAVRDYEQSIKLRPNAIVASRLEALKRGAAGSVSDDALGIAPLAGPQATAAAACTDIVAGLACAAALAPPVRQLAPAGRWQGAVVASVDTDEGAKDLLIVRTERGWFVRDLGDRQVQSGRFGTREALTVNDLAARPLGSRATDGLLLRYTVVSTTGTDEGDDVEEREWWLLCGIGASGAPSCTDPLLVRRREAAGTDRRAKASCLKVEIAPEQVVFSPTTGPLVDEQKRLLGAHRLVFP